MSSESIVWEDKGCKRFVVACRHKGNGAVLARCSQPEVGWLGYWRSREDEYLLKAIAYACAFDRGHAASSESNDGNGTSTPEVANPTRPEEINGNIPSLVSAAPQGVPVPTPSGDQPFMDCNASTASNASNPDSQPDEVKIPMYTGNVSIFCVDSTRSPFNRQKI